MDLDGPDFLNNLREALRHVVEGGSSYRARRVEPRAPIDEFKITELPEFNGSADPEVYLERERKIEHMFDFKELDDEKRCKYAILRLGKSASLWYEGLKSQRVRDRKPKVTSWESLKRKLRKRYVPSNHRLNLYKRISDLMQGKMSVSEYIDEFENLCLMSELEENEEQKMSRFLRGLNKNIAFAVELCNYNDFNALCVLCLKIENQQKSRYVSSWSKGSSSGISGTTAGTHVGVPRTSATDPRTSATAPVAQTKNIETTQRQSNVGPKETSLAKVRCFKCQGFGHFARACPNQRVVTLREAYSWRDEIIVEEEELDGTFNF